MKIGVIKEIKTHEYRVGLTPSCVKAYSACGHKVIVERGAGENIDFDDGQYKAAGAIILADKRKIFDDCDMIVKVKKPLAEEYELLNEGQILYTYLHLAASRELIPASPGTF